jgi:hypothetical protein
MPDFTVIEGGGRGGGRDDFNAQMARQAFERLAIELLRALGRGDDWGCRVSGALTEFVKCARETEHPLARIVHETVEGLFNEALAYDPFGESFDQYDSDRRHILQRALKVTAESMASDPAAKGRRSSRMSELNGAIEQHLIEMERRARENGWSYVHGLVERLGPWPPPRPTASRTKSKKRKK